MGWILFIEQYFTPVLIAVVIGFLFPSMQLAIAAKKGSIESISLVKLIINSISCSFKLAIYTFIGLVFLAFVGSILFSLWAIGVEFIS